MIGRLLVLASVLLWAGTPIAAFAQGDPADEDGTRLPRPTNVYTEKSAAGIQVRLEYLASEWGAGVVFRIGPRDRVVEHPPLEEQGRILDHLLGKLFKDHPDKPSTLVFSAGEAMDDLVELLDKKLQEPGADWDPKRGRPRHGQFGKVLMQELGEILATSPLAKAFEAHGYKLKLEHIGRISIEPMKELGGGLFPKNIITMEISAARAP